MKSLTEVRRIACKNNQNLNPPMLLKICMATVQVVKIPKTIATYHYTRFVTHGAVKNGDYFKTIDIYQKYAAW